MVGKENQEDGGIGLNSQLRYADDGLDFVHLLEFATDDANILYIMDFEIDFALEDAIVALDGEVAHVDIELLREDGGDAQQHTCAVDALDTDGGGETKVLVRIPTNGEDVVAIGHLEAIGLGALALVDGDVAGIVEMAKHIVAGDGMATGGHDVASDGFLAENDGFATVDGRGRSRNFSDRRRGTGIVVATEEAQIATPVLWFACPTQVLKVGIAQGDAPRADGEIELFARLELMEVEQLVDVGAAGLHVGLLEELVELALALFLSFTVLTAQEGLNLILGLTCGDELQPLGLNL